MVLVQFNTGCFIMQKQVKIMRGKAPPLANTPASGSQQATQLSPRAAPPAECHDRKINNGS